ncbi:multiple monosaccharide ABC transporter permease [Treponema sp.]|uniref:multiple monosaccharide ABC transporter permease n=1 Tax=Treponema sp. TaxID=166 RepID=UPI001D89F38D|nr:multiple monosaccharide ABC transporter permease [Treponema sp.]MBS7242431.1 sugar ABC transporter permease [Treponema sp.]MDY4133347.1 multiple monosaccharide ABC transporter permease [Treponema sp.]
MANIQSLKKTLKGNTMILILLAVMLFFQLLIVGADKGSLFAPENITNLINQNAWVVILATGMLLCILTGGNIDLSVGSVICLVGAVAGILIVNMGWPVLPSIIICLIVGAAIGAWHGFFIAYVHIPPFICTLSGMLLWRGVALILLNGMTISPFPDSFLNIFGSYLPELFLEQPNDDMANEAYDALIEHNEKITFLVTMIISVICCFLTVVAAVVSRASKIRKGYSVSTNIGFIAKQAILCAVIMIVGTLLAQDKGLPLILVIVGIIVGIYSYYTQNTVPGRYLYAIGGNEKAARLSGINTDNVMMFAYTNMGFIAGIAGLVCAARLNSAAPTVGQSYEMDAIASCFIGGASAYGGTGTVGGAVIGAIFMGVLNNGMSILGVDSNWQRAVKGMVLLLAVIFDVVSKKKKSSK